MAGAQSREWRPRAFPWYHEMIKSNRERYPQASRIQHQSEGGHKVGLGIGKRGKIGVCPASCAMNLTL